MLSFSDKYHRGVEGMVAGPCLTVTRLFMLVVAAALCASAADQKTQLTFSEFATLVSEQSVGEKVQPNPIRAAEAFSRLLAAQSRVTVARQSLARLSGWYQAAQARAQAQSAPASDLELLRFANAQAAVRVARFEAERLDAMQQANALLKRPPSSDLVALLESSAKPSPEPGVKTEPGGSQTEATAVESPQPPLPEPAPDLSSRKAHYEKELLPLGKELLSRMYQSYLFGGLPLTSLLWQEREVYSTELEYRLLLVRMERIAAAAQP